MPVAQAERLELIQRLKEGGFYIVGDMSMTDDRTKTGNPDRQRISLTEAYEVRDWAEKFGVTEDVLREAVARVGNDANEVAAALGKAGEMTN